MPKSRTRTKAVYTPPARSSKSKVSPRWLAPTMVGALLVGLAWIATFYVSNGSLPIGAHRQLEPRGRVRLPGRRRGAVDQVALSLAQLAAAL